VCVDCLSIVYRMRIISTRIVCQPRCYRILTSKQEIRVSSLFNSIHICIPWWYSVLKHFTRNYLLIVWILIIHCLNDVSVLVYSVVIIQNFNEFVVQTSCFLTLCITDQTLRIADDACSSTQHMSQEACTCCAELKSR
jgi:hypothetical protein